jgi:hypothetical protein
VGSRWDSPLYASTWDYGTETNSLVEVGTIGMTFTSPTTGLFRLLLG